MKKCGRSRRNRQPLSKSLLANIEFVKWLAKASFSFTLALMVALCSLYANGTLQPYGFFFSMIPTVALCGLSFVVLIVLKDI